MKRTAGRSKFGLAVAILGGVLALLVGVSASCQERPGGAANGPCPAEEVLQDITLLEQLNRLGLKPEQVRQLLQEAQVLQKDTARLAQQRRQELTDVLADLERKRGLALKDTPAPAETEARIEAALKRVDALVEKADEAVRAAGGRVRAALTKEQVTILLGEEEQLQHALQVLEGFRTMTAKDFDENAPPYADEVTQDSDAMSPEELMALLRRARALKPDEYRTSKSTLARELLALYVQDETQGNRSLGEALLNDRIIPVLSDLLQGAR